MGQNPPFFKVADGFAEFAQPTAFTTTIEEEIKRKATCGSEGGLLTWGIATLA
jgi:hypothetical protein